MRRGAWRREVLEARDPGIDIRERFRISRTASADRVGIDVSSPTIRRMASPFA